MTIRHDELSPRERSEATDMLTALEKDLQGWNVRCNSCGHYGARWRTDIPENPGFGKYAACDECHKAIKGEIERHREAMERLAAVRFPIQPTARAAEYAYEEFCMLRRTRR